MPIHHSPTNPVGLSSDQTAHASGNLPSLPFLSPDPVADNFEFISESFVMSAHPACAGVAEALRRFNGPQALQIAERHLETLLRVAPNEKHELALSHGLVAGTYEEIGETSAAMLHWEAAATALRGCPREQKQLQASVLCSLANCQVAEGKVSDGRASFRHACRIYRMIEKSDPEVSGVVFEKLLDFGEVLRAQLELTSAKRRYRQAYEEAQKNPTIGEALAQHALIGIGRCHLDSDRPNLARSIFTSVARTAIEIESPPGALHFYSHAGLAEAEFSIGGQNFNGALTNVDSALKCIARSSRGQAAIAAHITLLAGRACFNRGEEGDLEAAKFYLGKCIEFAGRSQDGTRPILIEALKILAPCQRDSVEFKKEGQAHAQLLGLALAEYGPQHEETIQIREARLDYFQRMRRWPEAIDEAEQIAEGIRKKHGGLSREYVDSLRDWAFVCSAGGRPEEAVGRMWTARRIIKVMPESEPKVGLLIALYSDTSVIFSTASKYKASLRLAERAFKLAQDSLGEDHATTAEMHIVVARALEDTGQRQTALTHIAAAHAFFMKQEQLDTNAVARTHHLRGVIHDSLRDFESSAEDFSNAWRWYERFPDSSDFCGLARDRAMAEVRRAEFFGGLEERRAAFEYLASVIQVCVENNQDENESTLALFRMGVRLAEDLELAHEEVVYKASAQRLEKRLRTPLT